jgi:diguanylate cyclase (GGDEF)-like protein
MPELSKTPIKVLLVEEDPSGVEYLRRTFASSNQARFETEWVQSLNEALERLSRGGIDVMLLDLKLPDSEGIGTFDRANAFAPDVPIVVLTDLDDQELAMRTVQGGAQDYLVKDTVSPGLLMRSILYALERHRLFSALRSLSLIDDLTGLYNRRGFAELGEQHLKLATRTNRAVTLVYVDLDDFKSINDSLGHQVGDRALSRVAEILKTAFRRSDIIARMGGDEFAVLALEASGDSADVLVDRLRGKVDEFNSVAQQPYRLSMSLGVARFSSETRNKLDEMLTAADRAMYADKRRQGRGSHSAMGPLER